MSGAKQRLNISVFGTILGTALGTVLGDIDGDEQLGKKRLANVLVGSLTLLKISIVTSVTVGSSLMKKVMFTPTGPKPPPSNSATFPKEVLKALTEVNKPLQSTFCESMETSPPGYSPILIQEVPDDVK